MGDSRTQNKPKTAISRCMKVLEIVYLVLLGIYLMHLIQAVSMLTLELPEWLPNTVLWCLTGTAAIWLVLKGIYYRRSCLKMIIPLLALAVLYIFIWSFYPNDYNNFLYLAALTAGAYDMDHRKILRTYLVVVGTFLLVTLIGGMIGAITDLIYFSNDTFRSSLGGIYPTDIASLLLFVVIVLWVAKKKLPDWVMLLLGLGSMWFSWFVTRSETSFVCSFLFILAVLYYLLERHVLMKHRWLRWIRRVINVIITLSFPLCMAGFFTLVVLYQKYVVFAIQINNILSDRLRLAAEAIQKYGLKLIGAPFEMIGQGSSVISNRTYYNMVDSSYALFLIYCGIIPMAILCIIWIFLIRRAIRNGNRRLILAMALVAIHSISEHHFLGLHYNIFLILPFANMSISEETQRVKERSARRWIAPLITATLCIAGGILLLPKAFTLLRTVVYLRNYEKPNDWNAIILIVLFLGLIVFTVWAIYRFIKTIVSGTRIRKLLINAIPLMVSLVIIVLGLVLSNQMFLRRAHNLEEVIREEEAVLRVAAEASKKGICMDTEPAVYQTAINGFADSILEGEELARFKYNTMLLDADEEYDILFEKDYLFLQISDMHAIYTDEIEVIEALQNAGYHLTGYYGCVNEVDLVYAAYRNGCAYSEETGLQVGGENPSLAYGPYVDLYGGRYGVTFELKLADPGAARDDRVACTLTVSSYWGENLLAEQEVYCSQFDEEGRLSIEVPAYISGKGDRYIEFRVVEGEEPLEVHSITYYRKPEQDVHILRNPAGQLVREEYYDLEGNPVMHYNYATKQLEYDAKGRLTKEAYFDENGQPCVQPAGYTAWVQQYDQKGNVISRQYLAANGENVERTDGYAQVCWEYDDQNRVNKEVFLDLNGQVVPDDDLNLVIGIPDSWSEWMSPAYFRSNNLFTIGSIQPGEKEVGDYYTIQFEIEFSDVTAKENQYFLFFAQSVVDGKWDGTSIWNYQVLYLDTPPEDGVYTYSVVAQISDRNADAGTFDLGFRCYNWASGSFRVNNVKIEKGYTATDWDPGI